MSQSIKKNYFFNLVNTLAGILFPLVTFPYASRIMEADGIGQVGFFTSIVNYISLFTSLGIPVYAIREIARVRDDFEQMNKTAVEILLLHTVLTIIGYIIVAVLCVTVAKITIDIPLFLILSLSILFNAIGCEWFYKGIEDFKYITIRGLIVRVLYVILLFSLVHSKSDLLIYAGLTVLGTVGNNLFNFIRLRKYISVSFLSLKQLNISRHIVPAIRIFALNLVISLYVNLDTIMLGFMKDNSSVGYYEGATRITKLVLGVVQALQTAMIPRFSYLAKSETRIEFDALCQKVIDFVVTISIPLSIGLFVMAPSLIHLFCGSTYTPAIMTMKIISPIIFLIALSGVACFQILYPLGKENLAILSTGTGAVVNFVICLLFIPSMAHNGAAIATLIGETAVTFTMFLYGKKHIHIKYKDRHYLNCLIGGGIMFLVIYLIYKQINNDWLNVLIIPVSGTFIYGLYLYIVKDRFGLYVLDLLVENRIIRRR